MFPQENVDQCIRIYPHLNNTGGFFVGKFTKEADFDESIIDLYIKRVELQKEESK